jgi:hypothetical protein
MKVLNFYAQTVPVPHKHTEWTQPFGESTLWPGVSCAGCCASEETRRWGEGLTDLCLLVLDFVSQSSFWESSLGQGDLLTCFLAFVED